MTHTKHFPSIFLVAFSKDCTWQPLKGTMQRADVKTCQKAKYLINRSAFIVAVVK